MLKKVSLENKIQRDGSKSISPWRNKKMSKKTAKVKKNSAIVKTATAPMKPSISSTGEPKKKVPKQKKVRETVIPAGEPLPAVGEHINPLLLNKRNKRALCIAFADQLGGAQGTDEQDKLLIRAVRESGILFKSGLNGDNYETGTVHLTSSEQSGRGYAMRTGRALHDDYMAQYPEKVAECIPFAKAFIELISKGDEVVQKERVVIKKSVGALFTKIRAAEAAKPKKEEKVVTEVTKTKAVAKTKAPMKPKVSVMKKKVAVPSVKVAEVAIEAPAVSE
jgi:hypothetical protein